MKEVTDDRWRRFFECLHRMLVILDDWLCDEFGFSRRPRGKHAGTSALLTNCE